MVRTFGPDCDALLTVITVRDRMRMMQTTLENVLDEVKSVNGFWSLSDQDVVRASMLEVGFAILQRDRSKCQVCEHQRQGSDCCSIEGMGCVEGRAN